MHLEGWYLFVPLLAGVCAHKYLALLCVFVAWIFRQPKRHGVGIVSSVDGIILSIKCAERANFITIARNFSNTVGLRAPIDGIVKKVCNNNTLTITIDNGSFEVVCTYKSTKIHYTNMYITRGSTVKRSSVFGCMLFCKSCEICIPSAFHIQNNPGDTVYGGISSLCAE